MKNPLTPAGIEPATFQFVAQHLNHCTTAIPSNKMYYQEIEHIYYGKINIFFIIDLNRQYEVKTIKFRI